jgi:hypothetical protein
MTTKQERDENDLKVSFIIQKAAGENASAEEYLFLLSACARIVDDILDDFEKVTQEQLLTLAEILFVKLPVNTFYKTHQEFLFSQHLVMWNTWEMSNVLEQGDATDKIYAHVLRDYINEILPLVALLTQGQSKMKEVNAAIRSLFKKELGK